MASSKCFVALVLVLAFVLVISSQVSARELVEERGYGGGYGHHEHGGHGGHGHGGHGHGHGHGGHGGYGHGGHGGHGRN